MPKRIYRSYSYVVFGIQNVGKTNIINRFIKDEFKQTHKITLGGLQEAILDVDGHNFRIVMHDTAGQVDEPTLKAAWRHEKDGFIFTFAINCEQSFYWVLKEIQQIKSIMAFRDVPILMVGNKIDLCFERKIQTKTAQQQANKLGVKYHEISAKQSHKQEIDRLIYELIDVNEMNKFYCSQTQQSQSEKQTNLSNSKVSWHPCEDSPCTIM